MKAKIFRRGGTPEGFRKQRSVVRRRHKNPIPITVARIVKADPDSFLVSGTDRRKSLDARFRRCPHARRAIRANSVVARSTRSPNDANGQRSGTAMAKKQAYTFGGVRHAVIPRVLTRPGMNIRGRRCAMV